MLTLKKKCRTVKKSSCIKQKTKTLTQRKALKSCSHDSLRQRRENMPAVHLLQIFTLCHLSFSRESKHFTSCSYLPVSFSPLTRHPTTAVIPPLLTSLCPLRCIQQDGCAAESRKEQGADRRTDRERPRSPWGFLTLRLPLTLSHLISVSLLLMCSLHPSSSLFFSLSDP